LQRPTLTGSSPFPDGLRVTFLQAMWHVPAKSLEPARMNEPAHPSFDLQDFLPYLLNQAAEAASLGFQDIYRDSYAITRTQWRVMANLGKFGAMTARDICHISHIEKTKVSRAVAHLEQVGLLARSPSTQDRRAEILSLTEKGQAAFADLGQRALDYDRALRKELGAKAAKDLNRILLAIIALRKDSGSATDD
jgi:DNA-binding MarR family transcriptional regulator